MELIERMEEMAINNYYDAVLHLGYLLQLNSGSFQSYQISLLLNRLHAAAAPQAMRWAWHGSSELAAQH
jgi:hypothetical protein